MGGKDCIESCGHSLVRTMLLPIISKELGEKGLFVIFEIATKYIYLSCMRESVFSFVKRDEVL